MIGWLIKPSISDIYYLWLVEWLIVADDATGFLSLCIGLSWKVAVAGKPSSMGVRGRFRATSSRRGHQFCSVIRCQKDEFRLSKGRLSIAVNRSTAQPMSYMIGWLIKPSIPDIYHSHSHVYFSTKQHTARKSRGLSCDRKLQRDLSVIESSSHLWT